jgi:hypothetical protein
MHICGYGGRISDAVTSEQIAISSCGARMKLQRDHIRAALKALERRSLVSFLGNRPALKATQIFPEVRIR